MIPATSFAGKRVAVFGLGVSGLATVNALAAGGAEVAAWDDKGDSVAAAIAAGVRTVDLREADWRAFDSLVLAPGVPLTHPEPHWTVKRAEQADIEIIGDIEIFCRERRRHVPKAPFVAITGTNGKSTTTALIAHILKSTGRDVQLGGNIGTAILSLEPPASGRYHVVECSSFQIDLAPSIDPSVGVFLNITPDHLDRHGTIGNYAAIKARLVAAADTAVIAVDDNWTQAVADRLALSGRNVVRVSARRPLTSGVYAEKGALSVAEDGASRRIAVLDGIGSLRGQHNAQNAAAAAAAARALGLRSAEIAEGLGSFPGLPHRMEEVGRRGRVLFVNDSKATNADAAAKALSSFSRIYWIAGGRAKEGGIASLTEFFPRIAKAYLIGEAAEDFAATLGGDVPHEMAGTLEAATRAAAADADRDRAAEPVVLLSPACASYDQFQNFEKRGDAFRGLVAALDGIEPRGEAA
jgi:UDP-N-acetylmuramoylalanine--D-glutamate ligase